MEVDVTQRKEISEKGNFRGGGVASEGCYLLGPTYAVSNYLILIYQI